MLLKLSVLSLIAFMELALALKMPSYMKACSRNDPDINTCATKSGRDGLPYFINGDRKYRIPNLNPFVITELDISQGTGINIKLRDGYLYGLDKTDIRKISIDLPNKKVTWDLMIPKPMFISKYNATGRILILPITGNGDANITLENLALKYSYGYDLYRKGPKKQVYAKIHKGVADYNMTRAYIRLDNLFNGDQFLSNQMHKFLNENWRDAAKEIGPAIVTAVTEIVYSILTGLCEIIPYDEMFPK